MNVQLQGHDFRYQAEQMIFVFFRDPENVFLESIYDEKTQSVTTHVSHNGKKNSFTLSLSAPFCSDDVLLSAYFALSPLSALKAPWGILSSTRPTKQARSMVGEHGSVEQAKKVLHDRFLVREDKIDLLYSVLSVETPILTKQDKKSVSLFVGIPICPSRCLYCSFGCVPQGKREHRIPPYLAALYQEIDALSEALSQTDFFIETVYVGGGTPTVLLPDELSCLFDRLSSHFDLSRVSEYTLEAGRPDTFTPEKLAACIQGGVNRLCINPQTMQDKTLPVIGRSHTASDVEKAFAMAREAGFQNINSDIILGLPGETEDDVADTLNRLFALSPEEITAHTLYIKRASDLKKHIEKTPLPTPEIVEKMLDVTQNALLSRGYAPYYMYKQKNTLGNFENVGYALPGYESLYNIYIIEETQTILSVGAGGVTKIVNAEGRNTRSFNPKDILMYQDRITAIAEEKRNLFL